MPLNRRVKKIQEHKENKIDGKNVRNILDESQIKSIKNNLSKMAENGVSSREKYQNEEIKIKQKIRKAFSNPEVNIAKNQNERFLGITKTKYSILSLKVFIEGKAQANTSNNIDDLNSANWEISGKRKKRKTDSKLNENECSFLLENQNGSDKHNDKNVDDKGNNKDVKQEWKKDII